MGIHVSRTSLGSEDTVALYQDGLSPSLCSIQPSSKRSFRTLNFFNMAWIQEDLR